MKQKSTELQAILNQVGQPYFLMCVSHLLDVGFRHMTEESVKETTAEIKTQDDSKSFMTNDFKIFIVETAFKISEVATPIDVVKFTSKLIR